MKGKKAIGIIGLGRFGFHLLQWLYEHSRRHAHLLAIDKEEAAVQRAAEYADAAFCMDATDKKALQEAGLQECDIAVVSIGEHMEESVIIVLNLAELGVPEIWAKANTDPHEVILKRIGATHVIRPEREMAIRTAYRILHGRVLDDLILGYGWKVFEIVVPEEFVGKTLADLRLPQRYDATVVAVFHDGSWHPAPSGDTRLHREDRLLVLSRAEREDLLG